MFSFLVKPIYCIYFFYLVIYSTVYCNHDVTNSVKINALHKNENVDDGQKHNSGSNSHKVKGHSRAEEIAVKLGGFIEGRGNLTKKTKVIISSKSFSLIVDNRTYFYGKKYYKMSKDHLEKCDYEITESDEIFDFWYNSITERITEIVYKCLPEEECCHGLECCEKETFKWYYYLVIIGGIVGLSITCFLIYRFCCDHGDYDTTAKSSSLKMAPKLAAASKRVSGTKDNQSDVKQKRRGSKVVKTEPSTGSVEIDQNRSTVLSTKLLSSTAAIVGHDKRSLAIKETSKVLAPDETSQVSAICKSAEK